MFEIFIGNAAKKALKNLNKPIVQKINKAILYLRNSPVPVKEYDIKRVEGTEDIYRLRISRYRIVYRVHWDNKAINVIKIEKKDDETYRL